VEQPIPYIPPPAPGIWPQNNLQQHVPFIPPPGGILPLNFIQQHTIPWIAPHNYHKLYDPFNVQKPPLGRPMLQAMLDGGLPMFRSLTSLVLDECALGHDFQTLWGFLHKAPALKKLTLQNCLVRTLYYLLSSEILITS
jgi:hypothetical protein